MDQPIYHIANREDAAAMPAQGSYRTASLETEGFVHCCTAEQLPGVLQRYYGGVEQVVLLKMDAELLTSKLVLENTVGGTELFPHIYGEINLDSIVEQKYLDRTALDAIAGSECYEG